MFMMLDTVRPSINVHLPDTTAYNLSTDLITTRKLHPGIGGTVIEVDVPSGITIGAAINGIAFDVGTGLSSEDFIHIHINGSIDGYGGYGGAGGGPSGVSDPGSPGQKGSTAIKTTIPLVITNAGNVRGGGGGGGGGGTGVDDIGKGCLPTGQGGNGGRGGGSNGGPISGGSGSAGGGGGANGADVGTDASNGNTGVQNCGPPPTAQLGGTGGSAGHYIDGSSLTIWRATGTRLGTTTG